MKVEAHEGSPEERRAVFNQMLAEQVEIMGELTKIDSMGPEDALVVKLRLIGNNLQATMNMGTLAQRHALAEAIISTLNVYVTALGGPAPPVVPN